MKKLTVTSNFKQRQTVVLDDGSTFEMSIVFRPRVNGWFITELSYGDVVLQGIRIVVSPNILMQYKNILPFGLACYSLGNREPMLVEDFSSENASLLLLSKEESEEVVSLIDE